MAPLKAARALLVVLLALLAWAAAAQDRAEEREIKAAFLYRFAGYVEWPDGTFARPDSPIVIGVAGNDPIYEQLSQTLTGRTIGRRPVTARRVQKGEPLNGIHMLFAGNAAGPLGAELIAQARKRPILIVTEAEGGQPPGSVINFATQESRVRFDVAVDAAETNGLRLSALLLSVARQVRGKSS